MKTYARMAAYSVVILAVAATTSLAQGPPREECGQVTTELGETKTSIQACMSELFDEQLLMIDSTEEMAKDLRAITTLMLEAKGTTASERATLLGLMDDMDDLELMREQLKRSRQENLAVEDSDHEDAFDKADQKKGKNCGFSDMPFVEFLDGEFPPGLKPVSGSTFGPKFGDGKCNVFKARIDNPGGLGDNDEVRVNERSENMCERVCDDRPGKSTVSGFGEPAKPRKEERKDRTVFSLTDNIAAARRANQELEVGKARVSGLREKLAANAFRMTGENTDSCEPFDVARILDELAEVAGLVKNAAAIVTASLELAKETARPPSKQDAAGFNASSAETPFSVAAGISKIVEQALGFIESGFKVAAVVAGRIQDFAQAQCLQNLETQVVALQASADETSAQLAALEAKVDALTVRIDEVLLLLRTPPGRRTGYPTRILRGGEPE